MVNWDIAVGEAILRRELHDRWGGGRYGGMEPAVKAESVFLFSNKSVGESFGYKYDGWHEDDTFHYTGDGQIGDQKPEKGGNKALLDAANLGRAVRLFRSEGRYSTYLGEFQLADPPYYQADAEDREGEIRSVLVFRLNPVGEVEHEQQDGADPDVSAPQELPVEANNVEKYAAQRPDEPKVAVRREAKLVLRYTEWLDGLGEEAVRHRIPIPGGGYMFTDVYKHSDRPRGRVRTSPAGPT